MSIADSVFCAGVAVAKDLPNVTYIKSYTKNPPETASRRPYPSEIEVYSFPQGWGSTALGFGGIGGQAITTAQTTVVICEHSAAVYFGQRLAYVVPKFNSAFMGDVYSCTMVECGKQSKYKAA